MLPALPFRSRARNSGHALAAPAAFVVVASRPIGADGCATVLRGEVVGTLQAARRHAAVDVHVPLFACTAGGAS